MYNPDGKECIARDNSCSLLRKEDISKAYFNCHTDITIPYYELGDITVHTADGRELPVIRQGRFVVPGTEELNKVLDESPVRATITKAIKAPVGHPPYFREGPPAGVGPPSLGMVPPYSRLPRMCNGRLKGLSV